MSENIESEVDELACMNKRLVHRITRLKEAVRAVTEHHRVDPADYGPGHNTMDMRALFVLHNALALDDAEAREHPCGVRGEEEDEEDEEDATR